MTKEELNQLKMIGKGLKVSQIFGNRLLIKTVKPHTKMDEYKKLLAIPDSSDKSAIPSTGIVVMLSKDVYAGITEIPNVGDMVMFSQWAGTSFNIDGETEDYRILEMKEVLCKLETIEEGADPYEIKVGAA